MLCMKTGCGRVINRRTLPIGTDIVNLVFPFMFLAGTSRSMEIQAIREADAIRSSEAQEESTNESIREAPESPEDDNQNKKDSAVSPSKKAEEKIEPVIGPEDSPRLERKQVLQPM